ncbi:hypothetical protein [Halobacillus halophilus]|uniref:hypothetical protein n=1 Tax=Halobacillus halophilus TaxID=1570 RepID=UPI001CD80BF3|nr:hypothetical protein [Halobacillus halophilus]MCA1010703.1 hypothetical protein [Halobacillus halophilus]
MGTLIMILIIGPIIIGVLVVVFEEGDRIRVSKLTGNVLHQLLEDNNINDYEYQKFEDGSYLLNDGERQLLYVIDEGGWTSWGYENIINVEFSIDDTQAYEASLSSATGRAIVGGALAGGVGAIIGGFTGKKTGRKVVNRMMLTVSFNTPQHPYKRIMLLNNKQGAELNSYQYEDAEKSGLYWSNLITSLMNQNK